MSSETIETKIEQGGDDRFFYHGLYRQIKFVEEAVLIVAAVSHLLMLRLIPPENMWVNRWTEAFAALFVYFIFSRIDLVDRSQKARLIVLGLGTVAACIAYAYGQPAILNPLFAVLVARAVLFVDGKKGFWVSGVIYFFLCVTSFIRYWVWNYQSEPLELGAAIVLLLPTFFYGTLWQGVVMAMVALLVQSLVASKKQMIEMERLNKEVSSMAAHLERARIARDIHDSVGHSLTSLSVQLEVARKLLQRDPVKSETALGEAEKMAKRSLRDVRNSIALMRVDDFDFQEALENLLGGIESGGAIKIERSVDMPELPPVAAYQVFRIIQESCTNCIRHSGADLLEVKIEPQDASLNIVVKDNGKGFDAQAKYSSFGLTGIRERVDDLRGNLEIASGNGSGTTVSVSIPLAAPS